jgi:RecB family exonuclease
MIDHLSYSSVNKYRNCPRSWRLHYLEGIKGDSSEALTVGSLAHRVTEKFLLAMHGPKAAASEKELDSIYYEEVGGQSLEGKGVELGDDSSYFLSSFLEGRIREILEGIRPKIKEDGTLALEEKVEFYAPSCPLPIIGYIDCLTKDNEIVDLKTSGRSWNQDRADKELQASFYATSLYLSGAVSYDQPVTVKYIVMVKNKKTKIQVIETVRTAEDITVVFNIISEVWKGIQKEVFFPNASYNFCSPKGCGAWSHCQGGKIV